MAITHNFSAGIVHVLDATTLETIFELQSHSNKVTTLAFTPDSRRLITGSDDGTVRFWDLSNGKPVGTLRVGARVRNVAILPDGNTLLTLSLDGWLRQWRAWP
jgi:WD40 repeat protein